MHPKCSPAIWSGQREVSSTDYKQDY